MNIDSTKSFIENLHHIADLTIKDNYLLAHGCSFKIGGPAKYALFPESTAALIASVKLIRKSGIRYVVIGNGSNVIFPDEGFNGCVIFTTAMKKITLEQTLLTADCGASLTTAAMTAAKAGLSGMEFAYGIPGSCGGALYMNAGAFNGQIEDILESGTYYDPQIDDVVTLTGKEHCFAYRKSIYTDSEKVILSATFRLQPGNPEDIRAKMDEYMEKRISKQPLEYPNAGSIFKRYPGFFTAQLIEEAGLKGRSVGGAQVSPKHAGFIVNTGNATASDVSALIDIIKAEIKEKYGIEIECEVRFIK